MKRISYFLLVLLSTSLWSQKIKDSFFSAKLGEDRGFTVVLPPSYEFETEKDYPLLVVLDGEYLIHPFDGILGYATYWDDLPEMIILAVDQSKSRFEDTSSNDDSGYPEAKGEEFYEYLGMELIPHIEKKYRTYPFRIVAGHDVTAGFSNFYLYKTPIFNAFISLAPEFAPYMETRIAKRLGEIKTPIFYYQASGGGDIKELNDRIKELDSNIKGVDNPNLRYRYDHIEEASHYSVVSLAIPRALSFIFDGYQPISIVEYKNKIVTLESGYTEYIKDKYAKIKNDFGMNIRPRLTDFKAIEAAIIKNKAYEDFLELSKVADKYYPKTTLGAFHKALYYEYTEDYKKAIKAYQRAFVLESIRELDRNYMIERAESLKAKLKSEQRQREKRDRLNESEEEDYQEEDYQEDEYQEQEVPVEEQPEED